MAFPFAKRAVIRHPSSCDLDPSGAVNSVDLWICVFMNTQIREDMRERVESWELTRLRIDSNRLTGVKEREHEDQQDWRRLNQRYGAFSFEEANDRCTKGAILEDWHDRKI